MAKKMARYFPTQRTIRLFEKDNAVADRRLVEANRLLTIANRRLYRQSYVYPMKVDIDAASAEATAGVEVYVLRDSWDLHGAYRYAMEQFYNANKEELQRPGAAGRWLDFRVQTSNFNPAAGGELVIPGLTSLTSGAIPPVATAGQSSNDFDYSTVVDADGNTKAFTLDVTSTATRYGIIKEWQTKDQVDADPQGSSTTMSYDGINADEDGENYTILRSNGAAVPYSSTMDLSIWTKVCTLQADSASQKLSSGFFDAPLGIVMLQSTSFVNATTGVPPGDPPRPVRELAVTVSFQKGDYKGVKAHRYATPVLTDSKEYEVV